MTTGQYERDDLYKAWANTLIGERGTLVYLLPGACHWIQSQTAPLK